MLASHKPNIGKAVGRLTAYLWQQPQGLGQVEHGEALENVWFLI